MASQSLLRIGAASLGLLTLLPATSALADSIWIGKGLGPISIKVDHVDNGVITFIVEDSGRQNSKKLADVPRLALDDEPAFTSAEEAFSNGNFAVAADGYRKAAAATGRPWVRLRCAQRLVEAGKKTNDLGTAVAGFAFLATVDPAAAQQAKPMVPPDAPKETIDAAVAQLKTAGNTSGISPDGAKVLLNFRIELLNAEHDTAGAAAALAELDRMQGTSSSGGSSSAGASADSPEAMQARAEGKLNEARVALAQKNYQQAMAAIESSASLFTDPAQLDDALLCIAEAKSGLASDDKSLMDAGLAYMRVVAMGKSLANNPNVPDALMKTAAIEEKLNKPEEALALYNQVKAQYPGTSAGTTAAQNAARIAATNKPKG